MSDPESEIVEYMLTEMGTSWKMVFEEIAALHGASPEEAAEVSDKMISTYGSAYSTPEQTRKILDDIKIEVESKKANL